MKASHTLGPWAYVKPDGIVVRNPRVYSDTGSVCNAAWLGDIGKTEANARLLAAAPDLLEALQGLLIQMMVWDVDDAFNTSDLARDVRAVIAKATGSAA